MRYFYSLIVIISYGFAFGQIQVKSSEGWPLYGATVQLIAQDGSMSGAVTDDEGMISCDNEMIVKAVISYVGYISDSIDYQCSQYRNISLEMAYENIEEMVITGQYSPLSTRKTVHRIEVISAQKILKRGVVELSQLLTTSPSIRITQDPLLGSQISVRGLGGEKVKILMDGVPLAGREDGQIDLSRVNLNDATRIEYVKGPMSVYYGTDALAGVIHIITDDSAAKELKLNALTKYETVGKYDTGLSLRKTTYNNWTLNIGGNRTYFDGFNTNDPDNRYQVWRPKENWNANLGVKKSFDKGWVSWNPSLFYETMYNKGVVDTVLNEVIVDTIVIDENPLIQTTSNYSLRARDQRITRQQISNVIAGQWNIDEQMYLKWNLMHSSFNKKRNTYVKDLVADQETLTTDPLDQDTLTQNLYYSWITWTHKDPKSVFRYSFGTEMNFNHVEGKRIIDNEQRANELATFLDLEWKPKQNIRLRPGLRLTHHSIYGLSATPSFHFSQVLHQNWNLRASVARGFRSPRLNELYFEFIDGNHNVLGYADLEPETSWNYEFSFDYIQGMEHEIYKWDINFFFSDVNNEIDLVLLDLATNLYQYRNINQTQIHGLESFIKWNNKKWDVGFGGTLSGKKYFAKQSSLDVFYSPEVILNIGYSMLEGKIHLQYSGKYIGRDLIVTGSSEEQILTAELDNYIISDVVCTYHPNKNWVFQVGCNNLFDVTDVDYVRFDEGGIHLSEDRVKQIGWGTTGFFQIKYSLN